MRTSDNFKLNLVEGSDIVNPLVQDVPNYEKIDEAMKTNLDCSVGVANHLKAGTVHALTRVTSDETAMIRFTATARFNVGDTFTVDTVQVSALLVDGSTLEDGAFINGSEVLCCLKGSLLTVYGVRNKATDTDKFGGELPEYYATKTEVDTAQATATSAGELANQINTHLTELNATHIERGSHSTDQLKVGWNQFTIAFDKPFKKVPTVVITRATSYLETIGVLNTTTTSFTLAIYAPSESSYNCVTNWIAIG